MKIDEKYFFCKIFIGNIHEFVQFLFVELTNKMLIFFIYHTTLKRLEYLNYSQHDNLGYLLLIYGNFTARMLISFIIFSFQIKTQQRQISSRNIFLLWNKTIFLQDFSQKIFINLFDFFRIY